jgi:predicted nucleic acid-binding protein
MKKIFIDANIFISSSNAGDIHFSSCREIFDYLLVENFEYYTSCDLITTIYYILARIDKQQALMEISKINKMCNIIEFGNREIARAIELMQSENYKDLEDTIQYILAQKSGCDLIISNDKNFISKDIQILSSKQFVETI